MEPEHQVVILDQEFTITCYSTTTPTWKKDGKLLILHQFLDTETVSVDKAKLEDGGEYACHGYDEENEVFSTKSVVHVAGEFIQILL